MKKKAPPPRRQPSGAGKAGASPAKPSPPKLPPRKLGTEAPTARRDFAPEDGKAAEHKGPEAGEMVAGKYRLDRMIARGGMGAVWGGWDTALDRPVAIKFMDPAIAQSKSLQSRFLREAKAVAKLGTTHVVQIFEHGVHDELPFIVMEMLEGEELHDRLKSEGRLSLVVTARIVTQIAKALRRAHSKGIIHRDLKPKNVYLAKDEDEEVVKLLDFGIAKTVRGAEDGDTTRTGMVLGSPNYMSPEQARGYKEIDHRTDLWSLGVIIFRMITGKPAFRGKATGDVIVKICTDPLPVASQLATDLPAVIDQFFERALARDPDERYQSAAELADAFVRVVKQCGAAAWARASGADAARLTNPGDWTPVSNNGTDPGLDDSMPSNEWSTPGDISGLTPPPGSVRTDATPSSSDSGAGFPAAPEGSTDPSTLESESGSPGSLTHPAVVDVDGEGKSSRKPLWVAGGVAAVAVALLAVGGLALSEGEAGHQETGADGVDTAMAAPPGEDPSTEPESTGASSAAETSEAAAGGAPAATTTSSATESETETPSVATVRRPPPIRRPPPPPATTKTTKKPPNWGY